MVAHDLTDKFIEHGIVRVPMGLNGTANVTYIITQDRKDKSYQAELHYRHQFRELFANSRDRLKASIIERAELWARADSRRRTEARFLTGIVERMLRKWDNED